MPSVKVIFKAETKPASPTPKGTGFFFRIFNGVSLTHNHLWGESLSEITSYLNKKRIPFTRVSQLA